MSRASVLKIVAGVLLLSLAMLPQSALACTACYGAQTDSPLANGMNWGILTLLGFILFVLSGISAFFIYVARRSATHPVAMPAARLMQSSQKV